MSVLGAKKGAYHSLLVKITATQPLPIIMTSPVQDSKNENHAGMFYFKVAGEDVEHYYSIERADLRAVFAAAPQNTVLLLTATGEGKKPETHGIVLQPQAGGPPVAPMPASTPAPAPAPAFAAPAAPAPAPRSNLPPVAPPAPVAPALSDLRPSALADQYVLCYAAACDILDRAMSAYPSISDPDVDTLFKATKEIATTLFIEWSKQAGTRPLVRKEGNGHGNG